MSYMSPSGNFLVDLSCSDTVGLSQNRNRVFETAIRISSVDDAFGVACSMAKPSHTDVPVKHARLVFDS